MELNNIYQNLVIVENIMTAIMVTNEFKADGSSSIIDAGYWNRAFESRPWFE